MSVQPPSPEKKGLRKAFFEFGSKAGMNKEVLEYFSHLLDDPKDFDGYKKMLIFKGDYVRTYLFTASFLYSQGRIDHAYDAQLGLVNGVYYASSYLPIYGLTKERIDELTRIRSDIGFVQNWLGNFYTKRIIGHGHETKVFREFLRRTLYSFQYRTETPDIILDELSREFKNKVNDIMVEVDKAIFPLASSHRQPQSGPEMGEYAGTGVGSQPSELAQISMTAVTGLKPPEK